MHNFFEGLMEFHFLQNALVSAVVIGAVAGISGRSPIPPGLSSLGAAISHAVFPGVALSFLLGINFFIGALVFGLLASFLIAFVNQNSTITGDTAIGITFSSFLALGVILIGVAKSSTDLFHILFGNILAVQDIDLLITLVVSVIVVVVILAYFKELQVTSFDPVFAQSSGMNVQFYHYLLMFLLALVSITAMQSVGTVMIVALLITPAATAYLYSNRLKTMLILAATFGSLSSVLGLYIGYTFNIAIGSTIVLTAAALFVVSFIVSPKQRERRKSHE